MKRGLQSATVAQRHVFRHERKAEHERVRYGLRALREADGRERSLREGDDECIGCEFDDLKKAKTAQAAISAVARKKFSGIKCRREGATVYVVKGQ
mgnify:CR=1 FL=1